MPVYFEYALKVSISLAITFLFYTLLLKRITHYTWNRYFLLIFSMLSLIVPLINIATFVQAQELQNISFVANIPAIQAQHITAISTVNAATYQLWFVAFTIFLSVSLILFLRLLVQLFSIQNIKAKATLIHSGEIKLYNIPDALLPFSFLNGIYINKDNYSSNELQEIIDHETVHVQQKHTIDVLVTEMICILNWYNPFVWLIKKAVRENLEFIADDAVISNGVNKKSYQYLLLKVTGERYSAIASNLKFSSIKNRIVMMNKTKTSQFHLFKFILLVPVTAFLLLSFRNTKATSSHAAEIKNTPAENYTLSTLTYSIPDEKVKAIVVKEKDKSFLRPGQLLNLTLISNEKERLKSLLEINGYHNLKSNSIKFWIDTASVNNSFSIEVKIDVDPSLVSIGQKSFELPGYSLAPSDKPLSRFGMAEKTGIYSMPELNKLQSPGAAKILT